MAGISAAGFVDIPAYTDETGYSTDLGLQAQASLGGATSGATQQRVIYIAVGIIIVSLAALWFMGKTFR